MKYTAKDIVYQARKFEEASVLLEQMTLENNKVAKIATTLTLGKQSLNHYLEPSLSLCGLSLELYLKAIYYYEFNKTTSGHHINSLYDKLKTESKESIKEFFEKTTTKYLEDNISFITDNIIPIISFEETLIELSDLFVSTRYMYENSGIEKNLIFREPMRQGIVNRINELGFIDYFLD